VKALAAARTSLAMEQLMNYVVPRQVTGMARVREFNMSVTIRAVRVMGTAVLCQHTGGNVLKLVG